MDTTIFAIKKNFFKEKSLIVPAKRLSPISYWTYENTIEIQFSHTEIQVFLNSFYQ